MTKLASKKIEELPKTIDLGSTGGAAALELDILKFLETRALIQASSGGGKSWLLRLIVENVMRASVPVWLIDPEGEYVSLRERFDVVIFGDDGADLPSDAETLRRVLPDLLRRGIACVFDLSEQKFEEQTASVVAVGESLMNAPKTDWKPLLLAVDEAQKLAPEGSSNAAMKSIADVASRGRKRGFGMIVATQRLSALDKNITTQLLNRFIGLCLEDIEINRAAGYIGKKNANELLNLEAGDFFALGSALNEKGSVRFRAGAVETSHPNSTVRQAAPDIPRAGAALAEVIRDLRAQITAAADAEDAARTDSPPDDAPELRREIIRLQRQLEEARKTPPVEMSAKEFETLRRLADEVRESAERQRIVFLDDLRKIADRCAADSARSEEAFLTSLKKVDFDAIKRAFAKIAAPPATVEKATPPAVKKIRPPATLDVTRPQQKILDVLNMFRSLGLAAIDRSNVAVFAGVSPNSGAFKNNLGVLRNEAGKYAHPPLIEYYAGGRIALTSEGALAAAPTEAVSSNADLHRAWFRQLKSSKKQAILEKLVEIYPDQMTKRDLARATDQSENSGSYKNNLGNLRSLGLIDYGDYRGDKTAFATNLLFPFA